jgi:hypothetical protein
MPFDKPTRTGGDFLDVRAETANGPRLIAFRILDLDVPPEDGDFKDPATGEWKKVYPVVADAMLIDGPNEGVIYRGKTYKYAITNALRGASQDDPNYTTHPGKEIAVRAERSKKKGVSTNTVWGNEPSDAELEKVEEVFARWGGWEGGRKPEDVAAGQAGAAAPAQAGAAAPAQAASGAANGRGAVGAPTRPTAPVRRPTTPTAPAQATGSAPRRPFGRKPA